MKPDLVVRDEGIRPVSRKSQSRPHVFAEQELRQQGGVISELMFLAEGIRAAAKDVARKVEHVAMAIDEERRGRLSLNKRQDDVEIIETVRQLVGGADLTEQSRDHLLERLLGLAVELRAQVPPWRCDDPGIDHEASRSQSRDRGSEDARAVAAALGVTPKEPPTPAAVPSRPRGRVDSGLVPLWWRRQRWQEAKAKAKAKEKASSKGSRSPRRATKGRRAR